MGHHYKNKKKLNKHAVYIQCLQEDSLITLWFQYYSQHFYMGFGFISWFTEHLKMATACSYNTLIHAFNFTLQHMPSFLSFLSFHVSLPGNWSKPRLLLPFLHPYWLATLSQLTDSTLHPQILTVIPWLARVRSMTFKTIFYWIIYNFIGIHTQLHSNSQGLPIVLCTGTKLKYVSETDICNL